MNASLAQKSMLAAIVVVVLSLFVFAWWRAAAPERAIRADNAAYAAEQARAWTAAHPPEPAAQLTEAEEARSEAAMACLGTRAHPLSVRACAEATKREGDVEEAEYRRQNPPPVYLPPTP